MSLSKGQIHSAFGWLTDERLSFEVRHECSKVEEMPNNEIAQIIDQTESAVRNLQHQALVALRRLMEK